MTLSKHKGAFAELLACAWLLRNDYEVYRNVSDHGFADIIALKDARVVKIDVKTVSRTAHGRHTGGTLSDEQIFDGVIPLYVTHDGMCSFSLGKLNAAFKARQGIPQKGKQPFAGRASTSNLNRNRPINLAESVN